jgi:hypothetical protein
MKKGIAALISAIIGVLMFAGVVYAVNPAKIIQSLIEFKFYRYLILLSIYSVVFSLAVVRWKLILSSLGCRISFSRLFSVKLVTNSISYFTPLARLGGEPVRAYILKKQDNIKLSKGIAGVLIDKILEYTWIFMFIFCGAVYILVEFVISKNLLIALCAPLLFFLILLYVFYSKTIRKRGFFTDVMQFFKVYKIKGISKVKGGVERTEKNLSNFFIKKKKVLFMVSLVSILEVICYLALIKLAMGFIGVDAGIIKPLVVLTLLALATTVPTPANLGAYEGMAVLAFLILGLPAESGLLLSLIIRMTEMSVAIIGILFIPFHGARLLKNNSRIRKG